MPFPPDINPEQIVDTDDPIGLGSRLDRAMGEIGLEADIYREIRSIVDPRGEVIGKTFPAFRLKGKNPMNSVIDVSRHWILGSNSVVN